MSDEERAARGGRDRRTSIVTEAAKRAWASRAEALEAAGIKLVEEATAAPVANSPANGSQISPKLRAGLQLLDAADKLWARLGRVGGAKPAGEGGASEPRKPTSLADYAGQRPRAHA